MELSTALVPVATAIVVGLLAWRLDRAWKPRTFSAAARTTFGASSAAVLFVGGGAAGYRLSRHDRFVAGTPWAGEIVWWQVAIGMAFLLIALYSLRRASKLAGDPPR